MRRFRVVGIFEAGVHSYDTQLAMIHIQDAARLFRMRDAVSGIRIRLADAFEAPAIAAQFAADFAAGVAGEKEKYSWDRMAEAVESLASERMEKS